VAAAGTARGAVAGTVLGAAADIGLVGADIARCLAVAAAGIGCSAGTVLV